MSTAEPTAAKEATEATEATEADQTTLTPGATRAGNGEYIFDLQNVNKIMGGPEYSPVFGACVEGDRMIVALMRYPMGKPSDMHSHPNEQWIYVLEGVFEIRIDDTWRKAHPGEVIYIPAGKMHLAANNGDKDVIFFTVKDRSHGLHGIKATSQD